MRIIITLVFLIGIFSRGIGQPTIDSILTKANFELYEHPEKAIQAGLQVYNSKGATLQNKIQALLLISTAYSSTRDYTKSLEYTVRAAGLLPRIDNDAFKIITYTRLGVQYQQLKIYNKAHSYLDKAIMIANNSRQVFDIHKLLGFNYAIRAMVYKEQMSCDIAQNYFNKALYHYSLCSKQSINDANLSVIIYNKGNCFMSLNEIDSARISFKKSYEYANNIRANNLKDFANKALAAVDPYQGNYGHAIRLLENAAVMSEGVGDLILNQGIYKGLSDNYLLTGDMARHELYQQKYISTADRIKKNDTETLNKFILQINADGDTEVSVIRKNATYYQVPLLAVALAILLATILEIFQSGKRLKSLKKEKEILENIPDSKY